MVTLRAQPGVVAVFTATDFPGVNDCGPIVHDDPILAEDVLRYLGQPVFAVIATSRDAARRAAALARQVLEIDPLPAVLDPLDAHARQQYVVPPMALARGHADQALQNAPHRWQGRFTLGGQEQFYLEGQISYALPLEDGGLLVHCSTQHPSEMQQVVAHALGLAAHSVRIACRRMGGGFGGKESQSALFACVAALAATRLQRPVKLRPDRDDDMLITGRRHGFEFDWDIGHDAQGRILAAEVTMVSNAGFSADLSPPVMTRALCHFDNAYWLPDVALHGYCAKTNTQSNTAFRGFGGPQGALAIEVILDSVARRLGRDALVVRQANFYGVTDQNVTPYGQTVEDNIIDPLVAQLALRCDYAGRRAAIQAHNASSPVPQGALAVEMVLDDIARTLGQDPLAVRRANFYGTSTHNVTPYGQVVEDNIIAPLVDQLASQCSYTARRAEIAAYNARSPVLQRGLALTPLKFGISFNVAHFNQAGAL
ncbi:MAG: xanthine dehydrogenase molybdopterin binding subunit, partial [Burkholderiales bacterium PBB5]